MPRLTHTDVRAYSLTLYASTTPSLETRKMYVAVSSMGHRAFPEPSPNKADKVLLIPMLASL